MIGTRWLHDLLEDNDDDNDGENDATDVCPKGRSNWMNDRTSLTDFDMDGCYDSTEDLDDDNDSVNDVNATGATLDLCPTTPLVHSMSMNLVVHHRTRYRWRFGQRPH